MYRLPRTHPTVLERSHADPTARYIYLIVKLACFALAGSLAAGGPSRLGADAFSTIRATGGAPVWAAVLAATGAALLVARWFGLWACRHALRGAAAVLLAIALGFAWSAAQTVNASWFGAISFTALALLTLVCASDHHPTKSVVAGSGR